MSSPIPQSTRQDRPPGYFPRRTSFGLLGMTGLAVGVPFNLLQSAAPFTQGGFDRWLGAIPYIVAFAFLPTILIVTVARTRKYWAVCAFFTLGCLLLFGYATSLLAAIAATSGLLPSSEAGWRTMSVVGLLYNLLLMGPAAWFLSRTLRLRYWQPGTTPSTWEPGDETPPGWAKSPSQGGKS
jgi:hypothetical protein